VPNPTYEAVCTGRTGHAEVVQLEFDPSVVSYREILDVFFAIHDPTTLNRQGGDHGTQYRSAIFWHDEKQRDTAQQVIERFTAEKAFDDPIVTEVTPLDRFWPAESYHRDYYRRNTAQPYCAFVISPKLAKYRKQFARSE
jgi:peptide-methionine (S)-S-oxide reductase